MTILFDKKLPILATLSAEGGQAYKTQILELKNKFVFNSNLFQWGGVCVCHACTKLGMSVRPWDFLLRLGFKSNLI